MKAFLASRCSCRCLLRISRSLARYDRELLSLACPFPS